MLAGMPRKAAAKPTSKATKSRPRTLRLSHDDERWVSAQSHPQGFSGVLSEAVRFYREHKDTARKQLLEAV